MSLFKKIMKYCLPLTAAGLMYCSSVGAEEIKKPAEVDKTEKKKADFNFCVGLEFKGSFNGNQLERAPKAFEEEAANPYLVFKGELIDSTTEHHLVPYRIPPLKLSDFSAGLKMGIRYTGISLEALLFVGNNFNLFLEEQAPQPHTPMTYYDIRYKIETDLVTLPLSFRLGYELNINNFVPSVSLSYTYIMRYNIYQGIEENNKYSRQRLIASGKGHLHSVGLGLTYLFKIPKRDDSLFELGLRLNYDFGSILFDSGELIKSNDFSLELIVGGRL